MAIDEKDSEKTAVTSNNGLYQLFIVLYALKSMTASLKQTLGVAMFLVTSKSFLVYW